MAVTKVSGTKAVVKLGSNAIELVKSAELTIDQDELDTTDNDSANSWREFIMGLRSGSFRFTCNWDSSLADSADQQLPFTEIAETDGGDVQTWEFYPNGTTTGNRKYSFSGYVKSASHPTSNNTVVEISVDVRVTGAVTVTTA